MLAIGVRREEEVARQQLCHDTADRPHIRYLVPLATLQDDLGRTVLPSADDRAVCLVEESGSAEIDQPHPAALGQPVTVPLRCVLYQFLLLQEDVFGLKISVRIPQSMHEGNGLQDLPEE